MLKLSYGISYLLIVATSVTAQALDTTWTGAVDSNWGTAGNWSNGVPGAGDNAIVNSGPVNAAANSVVQNLGSLTINGGTVEFLANFAGGGSQTLTITGAVAVNGGTLILNSRALERTFVTAGVDTTNDEITTQAAHGLATQDQVTMRSTPSTGSPPNNILPAPLLRDTAYFARVIDADTISLHPTALDAQNNTNKVDLTSTGALAGASLHYLFLQVGAVIQAASFTVAAGAVVHADGKGFAGWEGPGAIGVVGTPGACHGGRAVASDDEVYGSPTAPVTLGSGGNAQPGGGAIKIDCPAGTVTVSGTIRANAVNAFDSGSGGSIWIVCSTFAGASTGLLQANAGVSSRNTGGGGRIAVAWANTTYAGSYECAGGPAGVGGQPGHPGTLALTESGALNLTVNNSIGLAPGTHTFGNISVANGKTLFLHSNWDQSKDWVATDDPLGCTVNCTGFSIAAGGLVSANADGYYFFEGPGGATVQGAAHGGRAPANADAVYGSVSAPVTLGSGGNGRWGGGAIKINCPGGAAAVDGTLSASGEDGGDSAAGGSVWIVCNSLSGGGAIEAKAGTTTRNGGGGGRIALQYATSTFAGSTTSAGSAYAGGTTIAGEKGTVTPGNLRVADGFSGQTGNAFGGAGTQNDIAALRFNLRTDGNTADKAFETIQIGQLVFDLSGISGISGADIGDIHVFTDANNNGVIDGSDAEVPNSGTSVSISGAAGTLTVHFAPGAFLLDDTALTSATVSSVTTATDVLTTSAAHGFVNGQALQISSTGALPIPAGQTFEAAYFARVLTATTFTLHPTRTDALNNTALVDLTSAGGGTRAAKTYPVDFILRMDVATVDVGETLSIQLNVADSKIAAAGTSFTKTCQTAQAGRGFAELTGTTTAASHFISSPPVFTTQPSDQIVTRGATATFSATAAGPGPITYQWKLNGVDIGGATSSSYTTPATVVGDDGSQYTVVATNPNGSTTSSIATLHIHPVITASAGVNGTISPLGATTVAYNGTQAYTITPNPGFGIASVLVDGLPVGASTPYTFTATIADHTISATFDVAAHTITATAGPGGSISPSGAFGMANGGSQTFTITPHTGYHIASVVVDGVAVGAVGSYLFTNVTASHTLSASFAIDTFTLTASVAAGGHGTISPSGAVSVNYGGSQGFTMQADPGWAVAEVLVDGISVGPVTAYFFTNVTANHTIVVSKYEAPESPLAVSASATPNLIQTGGMVQLSCLPGGGSGLYVSFTWSGPGGFSSAAQTPGAFSLKTPGAYTYSVTVTDAAGLTASDSVTVVVGVPLNSVLVKGGGLKYRVYADSATGNPRDRFRLTVWGLELRPGDRVAFQVNGVALGDLSAGDGLTLDGKGRAGGQLGTPPHVFTDCQARYQVKRRRLLLLARDGWADTAGASVVQATSGTVDGVTVAVLVDRAPTDGIVDLAAVLPLEVKVRVQAAGGAIVTEAGKGSDR